VMSQYAEAVRSLPYGAASRSPNGWLAFNSSPHEFL
jgi:hypothetical protein